MEYGIDAVLDNDWARVVLLFNYDKMQTDYVYEKTIV